MVICMEIKRDEYLQRLIVRRHNGFIKVITGIRRSGKSYLLNTLFYNYLINESVDSDHIIKFAFDSAEDLLKIGEDPIVLDNEKDDRKVDPKKFLNWILPQINDDEMYYILLDEVQKLGAFESVLNGFLRKSNTDVFVTGSNSKFLSKDILTEFEGRGDEIHIYPLTFKEFMEAYDGDMYQHCQGNESYQSEGYYSSGDIYGYFRRTVYSHRRSCNSCGFIVG